LNIIFIFCFFS